MLVFIDVETTGLSPTDKICSVAVLNAQDKEYKYALVNEGKKIPPEASSIHHITNEMIKESVAFKSSEIYNYLQTMNLETNTLVGHNVKFDLEKLASAGFVWKGDVIDTLKLTKHLIPECELFSLQVLRYELKLYKNEELKKQEYGIKDALVAHNALSDTLVDELLLEYLLELATVEEMKELSFKNVLLQKFAFGKYKGRYIEEICMNDRNYVAWMLSSADIDEDTKYSINYYTKDYHEDSC